MSLTIGPTGSPPVGIGIGLLHLALRTGPGGDL